MIGKKYLNKRGFAIQFNWLFVLIGGAVILGFFISLITNQSSQSGQITAQEATRELDSLLKVSLAAGNTLKTVDFIDEKISFYCDDISEYYIEGALKSSRYDYNAIFSPTELKSKEVIIQTLVFEAPFRAMPLVYVTNKDTEYVFVINSTIIAQVYNAMPDNTTSKVIRNPDDIISHPDNNYDRTVFVLDIRNKSSLVMLTNFSSEHDWKRIYAIVINATNAYNYGNISFYKYNLSENPTTGFVSAGSAPFIGLELVLGGVISHDKTIYNCTLRKVLQRVALLSKLHEKRMSYYGNNADAYCRSLYINPTNSAEAYLKDIHTYAQGDISLDNFNNLFIAINQLKSLNKYILTKTDGCPLIY